MTDETKPHRKYPQGEGEREFEFEFEFEFIFILQRLQIRQDASFHLAVNIEL